MRIIALGRRNYLLAGSDSGGERAASIYSLVMTASLNGLNPKTCLKDFLAKITDGHTINRIDELVPWRMIPVGAERPKETNDG
jgi:transposase